MNTRRLPGACLIITLITGIVVAALWRADWPWDESEPAQLPSPESSVTRSTDTRFDPGRDAHAVDPSIVDYLGSAACRSCHPQIWEKYQSHPMAHSASSVMAASPIEDYVDKTEFAPPGNRRYRVERTTAGVLHHEIMVDSSGDVIYDQEVAVDYVIGSGKRGRGYIIDRAGLLFASSISWFTGQHAWGLSPEYLPDNHQRFERRVTGGCLTCHTGLPNFVRDEIGRFRTPPVLEAAIGCERCHGPGRQHVIAHESGDLSNDPITNPGKLDVDRREAVCAQCHLHGETRILRTDRTPHDFRPGERLDANWIVFVKSRPGEVTRAGRAASQVEHMVSSVCFQRSAGKMGCISCHDPHSVPEESSKHEFFRQRCLECHADRGCSLPITERQSPPAFDNCTKCHMASVSSANFLHRSVADHRILRRPSETNDEPAQGESRVFAFAESAIPEAEVNRARAIKLIEDALGPPLRPELAHEAYRLLIPLLAESPVDPELFVALGNSCQLQNRYPESVRWRLEALKLNPRHETAVQNLATLFHDHFQLVPAELYLKRFLDLNPWHGSYHGRLAATLMYRGDKSGAISSAERGLELNPTLWELHNFLSMVYTQTGDLAAAAKHRNLVLRKHSFAPPSNPDR